MLESKEFELTMEEILLVPPPAILFAFFEVAPLRPLIPLKDARADDPAGSDGVADAAGQWGGTV